MSVELISILTAIVAVGVALAGVILTSSRGLRQDMRQDMMRLDERIHGLESQFDSRIGALEFRLDEKISALESRLDEKISGLESRFDALGYQFGELRERMAHLEGLLEGLREAITGRIAAS